MGIDHKGAACANWGGGVEQFHIWVVTVVTQLYVFVKIYKAVEGCMLLYVSIKNQKRKL